MKVSYLISRQDGQSDLTRSLSDQPLPVLFSVSDILTALIRWKMSRDVRSCD